METTQAKENFIIVDQDDNVMFGGQRYTEAGADKIWNMYNGIYEDEDGERYIYVKEIEDQEAQEEKKVIKRSRANRTTRATYRNIRNEHKFIEVVHHGDGHYYMIQYMKHELPERTIVNFMGHRCGRKQKFRVGKATLMEILEDYKKVEEA